MAQTKRRRTKTPKPDERNGKNSNSNTQKKCSKQVEERHNDPNWYFLSPEVADQASTFSFNQFNGTKISFPTLAVTSERTLVEQPEGTHLGLPSILAMYLNPSPCIADKATSGVNMAALRTYAMLSSRNAKTTNYAPQDITMLILSMGEIVSLMEYVRRAFGLLLTFNMRNRAVPDQLFTAMGIDYDDFNSHAADYRLRFNTLVASINGIPFPANISYIAKCIEIYQRVYLDSPTDMATMVFSRPYSTWNLNETISDKGTVLTTSILPDYGNPATMDAWLDIIDKQIQDLLQSATFNFIYSDILMMRDKYSMPLFYMDILSMDYAVVPEYNANYLLQVHNSRPVGAPATTSFEDYTSQNNVYTDVNTNQVFYKPLWDLPTMQILRDMVVDFPIPNPTVVDRIEATRYGAVPINIADVHPGYLSNTVSDHYVVQYVLRVGDGTAYRPTAASGKSYGLPIVIDKPITDIASAGCLSMVNYGPIVPTYGEIQIDDRNVEYALGVPTSLDYFTTLDREWFTKVNDLTSIALFSIR